MITIRDLMYACKLKLIRVQRNIKQEDAAMRCAFKNQQEYSDLESGKKQFKEENIRRICEGFKIPVGKFRETDLSILNELLVRADMPLELTHKDEQQKEDERYMYLLEFEKRVIELKLELARKEKTILELRHKNYPGLQKENLNIYVLV